MDWRIVYRDAMIVFVGLGFIFIQQLSPNGTFFGNTVAAEFPATSDGRRIRGGYRWGVGLITAAAVIMAHVGISGWIYKVAHTGGGTVLWIVGHYRTRAFRHRLSSIRIASIERRELSGPAGWLFFISPILILAATALFLRSNVATTRVWFFAALCTALCLWLAYIVNFRTRRVSADDLPWRRDRDFKRSSYAVLMMYAYIASLAPAFFTAAFWLEFQHGNRTWALWSFRAVVLAVPLAIGLRFLARWPKGEPQGHAGVDAPLGDGTPDECWKLGLIYYNPADPAFIVTRRMGWGWELNWANKWSWVFALAVFVVPISVAKLL